MAITDLNHYLWRHGLNKLNVKAENVHWLKPSALQSITVWFKHNLIVCFKTYSNIQYTNGIQKTLDPLWKNFLDPRM